MKLYPAIINDDEAPRLRWCFESLGRWRDSLDIIFVDNCSRDNSVEIAKDIGTGRIVTMGDTEEVIKDYRAALQGAPTR